MKKGIEPIIPYPANHRKGSSIEKANSRLNDLISLWNHRLRELTNMMIHVLNCILAKVLVAKAVMKIGRPRKVRSITYFTSY